MTAQQLAMQDLLCTECSNVLNEDTRTHENIQICDDCYYESVGYCDYCGYSYMQNFEDIGRFRDFGVNNHSHMLFVDGEHICSGCVHECPSCETLHTTQEMSWECCPEEDEQEELLHYYSFRPSMKYWNYKNGILSWGWTAKLGELYMGIEIEIEKVSRLVREAMEYDGTEDWHSPNFYYWKADGSLSMSGAELVTMPATLEAHARRFPFEQMDKLHKAGARAWAYEQCGMHIHVSRSAFGAAHMWKFIKFQLFNHDKLAIIAGRDSEQWASWGNETMSDARKSAKQYVKQGPAFANRYSALNFNNSDTVELRYFRSNIAPHGIMRNLELVHAMWAYTKQMTVRQYIDNRWSFTPFVEFMQDKPQYITIYRYIKNEGVA
jgi:hypothetical protein